MTNERNRHPGEAMDCPTCGLTNPPEALKCDCGYDFRVSKPSDLPGWQINLTWGQKIAAFWSISWPAWIASFVLVFHNGHSFEVVQKHSAVVANLAFFMFQALLTLRLVRKNYRSFRVYVLHDDGTRDRRLRIREAVSVWLWIVGPQLALLLSTSVALGVWGTKLPPDTVSGLSSMYLWIRLLIAGPYAVGLALRVKYPAFRLQAHGLRYV